MANEEHLQKLREGVEAWNAWRKQHYYINIDLSRAGLYDYLLSGVDLGYANLRGSNLSGVDFESAKLHDARLIGADLTGAKLRNARLDRANLRGANLWLADLRGAHLSGADLTDADLTGVRGLELDSCRIVQTRFSPRATDKWSILRRTYTGPNLLLNLLFVLMFFAPLIVKGAGLAAFGDVEQRVAQTLNGVSTDHLRIACAEPEHAILGKVRERDVHVPCRSEPMWKLLLGFGGPFGVVMPILTGVLISYQIARYLLTRQVSLMRDAEERSGISPPKGLSFDYLDFRVTKLWPSMKEVWAWAVRYPRLYRVHQIMRIVLWIGWVTFALRAVDFLFLTNVMLLG